MRNDPRLDALFRTFDRSPARPVGLLQKIAAVVVGAIVFGLALTVSVVFLAFVVAAGAVIWGYLWWKTRDLRKAMREAQTQAPRGGGRGALVIEGEVVREIRDDPEEGRRS